MGRAFEVFEGGGCLGLTLVRHSFSTVRGWWFMVIVLFNICSIM